MIAENLMTEAILPLRTSDTGDDALAIMGENFVRHLPIVNNHQLLGLLSEDDIFDNDASEPVGSYRLTLMHARVRKDDHVYEVMRQMAEYQLTVVPVVDLEGNYIGMITLEDVLRFFAESNPFRDPGGIIVLEVARQDYSMAEIARIVESENALILSSFVQAYPESSRIDVTLKINRQNIWPVLATFERFNYQVKASFGETDYYETLKERYDALMTYLKV
jgi:CBS domain-containing protein